MIKWKYYFARKFSVQRYEAVVRLLCSRYWKEKFDAEVKNIMIAPEGKNHAIYLDEEEWNREKAKVYRITCQSVEIFDSFAKEFQTRQKQFEAAARAAAAGDLMALSHEALLTRYSDFFASQLSFFESAIFVPFTVEPMLSEDANAALVAFLERRGKMKAYNTLFELLFAPEQKNAITRAREELLELAAFDASDITVYAEKWAFIPCYDFADTAWDAAHFKKELDDARGNSEATKKELSKLRRAFELRKKKFAAFLEDVDDARTKELFIMAKKMAFIKDERDDYRRLGTYLVMPLYHEIARRADVALKECVNMTSEEVKRFLSDGSIEREKLRERAEHGYVLLRKGGDMLVFEGASATKVIDRELANVRDESKGDIRGIVGSKGVVEGHAVIIKTKHDLRRITDGAIMIAVTTHPDFVPAMRTCAGIVTDEGGITSHAAIVSRELGIPCIVGTGNATRAFIEGERVRVDANSGMINHVPA